MLKRRVRRGTVAAAAAAMAFVAISISCGILSFERFPLGDSLSRTAADPPQPLPAHLPDVAIVAVDPNSMQESRDLWPWPRGRFAEIVYRLDVAGAKVVAFSFDFSKRLERRNDMAFARAIKESRHVVLAAHRQSWDEDEGDVEIIKFPAPEFTMGAAAVGHTLFDVDSDGVVRHGFRDRRIAARALPSLCQAAVAVALGQDPVPSDSRRVLIDYRHATPAIPMIPVADILEGRFDARDVAGRIVFVGGTGVRFHDLWTTPLGPNQPGVYLQALTARTLLAEHAQASAGP